MCVGVFMQIFVFVFLCKRKGAIEGRGKNGREARDGEEGEKEGRDCLLFLCITAVYI